MYKIKIYSKCDLEKRGIDFTQVMDRIVEIDGENGLNEDETENIKRLTAVFEATANMWQVIVSGQSIIGYWNCVILNDKYQKQIKQGYLQESDINIMNLKTDLTQKINNMLFDSICLVKEFRCRRWAIMALIKSIYNTLSSLSEKEIKIDKIFGSVWNSDAEKIFKKLGFVFQTDNHPNGKIFSISFDELMRNLKPFSERY